jgi:hypothetical protein
MPSTLPPPKNAPSPGPPTFIASGQSRTTRLARSASAAAQYATPPGVRVSSARRRSRSHTPRSRGVRQSFIGGGGTGSPAFSCWRLMR